MSKFTRKNTVTTKQGAVGVLTFYILDTMSQALKCAHLNLY